MFFPSANKVLLQVYFLKVILQHTTLNFLTKGTIKTSKPSKFFLALRKKLVDETELKVKQNLFKIIIAERLKFILNVLHKKSL